MARGLELTLIGMGVVMGGLALLALVVRGLEPLAALGRRPTAGQRPAARAAVSPGEGEDPAVVAAIAAALAAAMDTGPGNIRLLSVQPARTGGWGPSGWALAGRTEQMRSRQIRGQGGGRAT